MANNIDFSLLTPQATPHQGAVANIPVQAPGSSQLDQLASGLLEGAKVGTSIKASNQSIAESQQRMQQQAQLFPSMLDRQKNAATTSDLDLQEKQKKLKSADEVAGEFHKSWDAGMAAMAKQDPAGYVKLQGDIATTKKTLQDTAKLATDNNQAALNMYNDFAKKGYTVAQAAENAEHAQPGSGEVVYQQSLKMMGPTVAAQYPPHFDSNTFHTLTRIGAEVKLQEMKDEETKNATNEVKNATTIGNLQAKVDAGKATPEEKATLDSLKGQIEAKTKKDVGGPSLADKTEAQATGAELKALDKSAQTAQTSGATINMMDALNKQAGSGSFENTSQTGKRFLQAASQALGIQYDPNTAVDEGFKHLSTLGRFDVLQNLRGRPNLVEFQQSLDSVPQITNTPGGRSLMISMAQYKNASQLAYRDFSHKWAADHNASLVGRDDAWNNFQASIGSGYDDKKKIFDPSRLTDGSMEKYLKDPKLSQPGAISPITHKPVGQFDSKEEFQKWYGAQTPEIQKDVKANPSKYGMK